MLEFQERTWNIGRIGIIVVRYLYFGLPNMLYNVLYFYRLYLFVPMVLKPIGGFRELTKFLVFRFWRDMVVSIPVDGIK